MTKQYFQCRLQRPVIGQSHVVTETTGWIEARGAKMGARVQLLPSKEFWEVIEVFDHALPEDMLKDQQKLNRRSLPSVDPIA